MASAGGRPNRARRFAMRITMPGPILMWDGRRCLPRRHAVSPNSASAGLRMRRSDSHSAAVGHGQRDADVLPHDAAAGERSAARDALPAPHGSLWMLVGAGVTVEAFLLALLAVAPLGGLSQTLSPLARAWPALLAPGRLIFGDAAVETSVPSAR